MKITILTQWYPPEPATLMHEMAQELALHGHDVEVITGFPNYPSGQLHPDYRLRSWMRERIDGIDILRTWLYPEHSHSAIKRIINYISFSLSATLFGSLKARRPDILFVYHPPLTVGFVGWVLSRFWRIPFIYQIQDMWPETLRATGMLNNSRILKIVGMGAKFIYNRADAICVISSGFQNNLLQKGVPAHKISVISNWVDLENYYPADIDTALAEELGLAGKFNIMFAGNIGEAQKLDTVLDAAEHLKNQENIQFVFVGDGVALDHLKNIKVQKHLTNVRFLGRYPAKDMPSLYAMADVLLVHLKNDPLFEITIPHKIFAYLASRKPLLVAVKGDSARIVKMMDAGLTCNPEDYIEMANVINQFYAMAPEKRQRLATNGFHAVTIQYNRRVVVQQIEDVMKKLTLHTEAI